MTTLQLAYLCGWLITVFDLPANHKSTSWCAGAAIACACWPVLLLKTVIDASADWLARNVK